MMRAFGLGFVVLVAIGCGASPAYEPEEATIEPPPRVGAWTAPPDDYATPFALGQTWVGTYQCAQGETDLSLHIVDVDGAKIRAIFEFEHGPSGAKGMFEMAGGFTVDRRSVDLRPTRWIRRPENYVTVAMRGTVSVGGKRFLGLVDGPGCSTFALRLVR